MADAKILLPYQTRELNLAWAAGFFEGEGTFTLQKSYERKDGSHLIYPRAQLTQRDESLLWSFKNIVGVGSVTGPYPSSTSGRDHFTWSSNTVANFKTLFDLLSPGLSRRRIQRAQECLAAWEDSRRVSA